MICKKSTFKFYFIICSALLCMAQKCPEGELSGFGDLPNLTEEETTQIYRGEITEFVNNGLIDNGCNEPYDSTQSNAPALGNEGPDDLSFIPGDDQSLKNAISALGGNPMAVDHANCFLDKNYGKEFKYDGSSAKSVKIEGKCKMIISDYTIPKEKGRMFMIDRCNGVIKRRHVASGGGEAGEAKASGAISEAPDGIGNKGGDKRTPRGFLVMGGLNINGNKNKAWYPGMNLHGLQKYNNSTGGRGILMHKAQYFQDKVNKSGPKLPYVFDGDINDIDPSVGGSKRGAIGHSWGCSAIDPDLWEEMKTNYMGESANSENGNVEKGPLVYNFGPIEAGKGAEYCGEEEWIK